ncbi:MAG: acetyl-CoA C-acyltransferase, partial [Ilumatobacteraceae bacterium]
MPGSYIISGARTPIGKLSGALASFSAAELGGIAIAEALKRAGVAPHEVEHVIMGQVLMAGQGQVPSRQAAAKAGIPMNVPSVNVNKVCLSGLNSIYLADQMIANGDADIVVAGGMESMTNSPYLAMGARSGYRFGDVQMLDAIQRDGLWCAFDSCLMGLGTERYAAGEISREAQDDLAMKSNQRAAAAIANGKLAEEIVAITIPQRKGEPVVVSNDEGVRASTTMESLASLKPAFDKTGTVTAGNASQISDAGSAVVMMSKRAAEKRGIKPLGEFISYGMVAGPDNASLLHQPSRSIVKALERIGKKVSDVDLFEINEAFAAVGVASMRDLGITDENVTLRYLRMDRLSFYLY